MRAMQKVSFINRQCKCLINHCVPARTFLLHNHGVEVAAARAPAAVPLGRRGGSSGSGSGGGGGGAGEEALSHKILQYWRVRVRRA